MSHPAASEVRPPAPFLEHLGLRAEPAPAGQSRFTLELRQEHLNHLATAHLGVVATLLESAMAQAARSRAGNEREVLAVDMQIAFVRPASGRLIGQARVSGGGRSVCFCEATLTDGHGEVAARAMGTFRSCD